MLSNARRRSSPHLGSMATTPLRMHKNNVVGVASKVAGWDSAPSRWREAMVVDELLRQTMNPPRPLHGFFTATHAFPDHHRPVLRPRLNPRSIKQYGGGADLLLTLHSGRSCD